MHITGEVDLRAAEGVRYAGHQRWFLGGGGVEGQEAACALSGPFDVFVISSGPQGFLMERVPLLQILGQASDVLDVRGGFPCLMIRPGR